MQQAAPEADRWTSGSGDPSQQQPQQHQDAGSNNRHADERDWWRRPDPAATVHNEPVRLLTTHTSFLSCPIDACQRSDRPTLASGIPAREACLTRQRLSACILSVHSACDELPSHVFLPRMLTLPWQGLHIETALPQWCTSGSAATQVQVLRRGDASSDPAPLRPQAILPAAKAPVPVNQHSAGPDAPAANSLPEWCAWL